MRPDCPKWDGCNAPLCPLDPDAPLRRHLRGEPLCLWLRELVKEDGGATLARALAADAAATVAAMAPAIMDRSSDVRTKLRAASRTGSKRRSMDRLRARREEPTP